MNHDIVDVVKNLQTISENNNAFSVLKDFERVLDELDMYVFKNWDQGELLEGPNVGRYSVSCTFMWDADNMPDPAGAKRLSQYDCEVVYKKTHILMPRKIRDPSDFRPGTKKGKVDAHPIWTVTIDMPKELMQDVAIGKENKENNQMAELMKYSSKQVDSAEETAQEAPANVESPTD